MTEDMELSTETPVDLDGQLQSVYYQRTFNLGNYENERIGISLKAQPGQTYEQVLTAAVNAVMKDHKEYDELREKITETRHVLFETERKKHELEREIERLNEEKAALQAAIDGVKADHPQAVQMIKDAALKVGDRVAHVGTVAQIDPDDKRAMYYVEWDGGSGMWIREKNDLVRAIGIDAPVDPDENEDEDPEEDDPEEDDFEDEDEDEEF